MRQNTRKFFQPFYRVDETRTRETGGTGLGLAIVANVVKEHHGAVWANASQLGDFVSLYVFRFGLPVKFSVLEKCHNRCGIFILKLSNLWLCIERLDFT